VTSAPRPLATAAQAAPLRIVSLVPSITELLVDMGLAPWLVGRTGFCIHPPSIVVNIAKVGGTKDVNFAKIRRLEPTHVIVNIDENTLPTVTALREFVPRVIVTHPTCPQDNLVLIDQILQEVAINSIAFNTAIMMASKLKQQLNAGLQSVQALTKGPSRVLYLIWRDPWMTVARDTYISRMLELIGWQTWPNAEGGESGAARYPVVTGDEAWLSDVQRVLLSSEPYRFDASHLSEVNTWLPQAQVQLVDGEMLSWYGSRAVQGLAYLAELTRTDSPSATPQSKFNARSP
jgi:ABC-type Fe3+-hydroxamate transport system substrate-binding protein